MNKLLLSKKIKDGYLVQKRGNKFCVARKRIDGIYKEQHTIVVLNMNNDLIYITIPEGIQVYGQARVDVL